MHTSSAYDKALADVKSLFKGNKFALLPLSDMFKQLPLNTSAGAPYYKQKSDVLPECRRSVTEKFVSLCSGKKIEQLPCLLALRGHLSPLEKIKTRPVLINSFDHIALENLLFRNVYDFVFTDPDMQRLIMTGPHVLSRLRNYLCNSSRNTYCNLDYSAWDTWRCRFAGRDLFKILEEVLDLDSSTRHVFRFVEKQFLDTIISLPDGTSYQKKSGTCTGSLMTALFNSLLNFVCLRTCFYSMEVDHCIENLRILGDDVAFQCSVGDVTAFMSGLASNLKRFFGLDLNPDKCLVVPRGAPIESRKFIGYTIRNDQLYRLEIEFFRYVLYVERPVEDFNTSFSRVVSYLLLGGISHQHFCRFVETFIGHYRHLFSDQSDLLDPSVFRLGNLRVIKHVFQMEVDILLSDGLTLDSFRSWDFISLPYKFTLQQLSASSG